MLNRYANRFRLSNVVLTLFISLAWNASSAMSVQNLFPYKMKLSTYNSWDIVYQDPWATFEFSPGQIMDVPAHDFGKCKIKIQLIVGDKVIRVVSPGFVYDDGDLLTFGMLGYERRLNYNKTPVADPGRTGELMIHYLQRYNGEIGITRGKNILSVIYRDVTDSLDYDTILKSKKK